MKRFRFLPILIALLALLCFCFFACEEEETPPPTYTATFQAGGVVVDSVSFTKGDTIIPPTVPKKDGYTAEWESYTLDSKDITINAVYTPITYTATFKADNFFVDKISFTIEDTIVAPAIPQKAGFISSWEEYEVVADNITVNAIYTPITYTATFMADGAIVDVVNFTKDGSVTTPAVPAKDGYTAEWEDYTLGAENITVNAVYTPITYTATFKADGFFVDKISFTVEDIITPPAIPKKTGYTAAWESYAVIAKNITVNAIYTPITYTATFVAEDVIVNSVNFTVETERITPPTLPDKAGYNGIWEQYTLGPRDITINAIYTLQPDFEIQYQNTKGAANTNPTSYNVETETIILESLFVAGYNFDGWFDEGGNKIERIEKGSTGSLVLNAVFTPITFTATFKADGVTVDTVEFTVETESITPPVFPAKPGYNGAWESYSLGPEDITINAVYVVEGNYLITYQNTKGASNNNPTTYNVETETIVLKELSVLGYEFDGWFDAEGNKVEKIEKGSTGNIVLNAIFTPIPYTVTFKADGITIATASFTVENKSITVPSVPAKTGYNGAWEGYLLGTESITVNAIYTPIIYTATFKADGFLVESIPFTVENTITPPAIPAKVGYEAKWENHSVLAENITVNAVYTPITYTATFKADGVTVDTITFTVESTSITTPSIPTKIGYAATWENHTVIADNITINAVYTLITYTATFKADGVTVDTVTFTVESTSITTPSTPKKTGYTATWENHSVVAENITVNAVYTPITYTATFVSFGETVCTTNFTVETESIELPAVPEQIGYTGGEWEAFSLGATDITINAVYTLISKGLVFTLKNGTYSVTDYTGTDANVIVPAIYNGKDVTSVGARAFENCTSLVKIEIPEGVTKIDDSAFQLCRSLLSITIPRSVTSIGAKAFQSCNKLIEIYNLSKVSITSESGHGFAAFFPLDIYTSPDSPSKILVDATGCIFYENGSTCYLLGYIGDETKLALPDNYNGKKYEIFQWAFSNCNSLESIMIPEGIASIENYTFYMCSSLVSATIPDSVKSIGESAFIGCSKLSANLYDNSYYIGNANNPYFLLLRAKDKNITGCIIHEDTKAIHENAFSSCENLVTVSIAETASLETIGFGAFQNCKNLQYIFIPKSVARILPAFQNCISLTDIYCGIESKPEGWSNGWLANCNATVIWGSQSVVPNTIVETKTYGESTIYILHPAEGYTLHTKELDEEVYDEQGRFVQTIRGYTAGWSTFAPNYDFLLTL